MRRLFAIGAVMIVAWVAPAWAQETVDGMTVPPVPDRIGTAIVDIAPAGVPNAYGVANFSAAVVSPISFEPYFGGLGYIWWGGGYIGPQTGDGFRYFHGPVYLPTGALLSSTVIQVYDNDDPGYVHVWFVLYKCPAGSAGTRTDLVNVLTGGADKPGYTFFNEDGSIGTTWKNYDQSGATINYGSILVYFSSGTSNLRIGPVMIWYQRQISPAPATATFPDVPTSHWAFRYVEALAASGITQGYSDGTFRPTNPVTRAQMATFLARALGLDYPDF